MKTNAIAVTSYYNHISSPVNFCYELFTGMKGEGGIGKKGGEGWGLQAGWGFPPCGGGVP